MGSAQKTSTKKKRKNSQYDNSMDEDELGSELGTEMELKDGSPIKKRLKKKDGVIASEGDEFSGPVLSWMKMPLEINPDCEVEIDKVGGMDKRLIDLLKNDGFSKLLPVQWTLWESCSGGLDFSHDFCLCSPTGSGKTLAYALPIIQALSRFGPVSLHCLRAIIMLPTKGLVSQVFSVVSRLCHAVDLRVGVIGASNPIEETNMLRYGKSHDPCLIPDLHGSDVLICTPGRLSAHLQETDDLSLKHLKFLVLDEADHMLKQQNMFNECIPFLMDKIERDRKMPNNGRLMPDSTLMKIIVSATVSHDPSKLARLNLNFPRLITLKRQMSRYHLPKGLLEFQTVCPAPLRPLVLIKLLKEIGHEKTIVFTSSVETTHRLWLLLQQMEGFGDNVVEYSSQLSRVQQKVRLRNFSMGKAKILVASDAAARGLDITDVLNVVNYDTPEHVKTYIHRVGRTARAGKEGRAFSLLRSDMDESPFNKLRSKLNGTLEDKQYGVEVLHDLKPVVDQAIENMQAAVIAEKQCRK